MPHRRRSEARSPHSPYSSVTATYDGETDPMLAEEDYDPDGQDEGGEMGVPLTETKCWKWPGLYVLNLIALWTHLIVACLVLGIAIWKGLDKCTPVTVSYSSGRPSGFQNTSSSIQIEGPGICFGFLAFAFEFVCFLAHFRVWYYYDAYESMVPYVARVAKAYELGQSPPPKTVIEQEFNPWRWNEYAVSASIMILAVASVSGSHSLGTLLGYVAANVGCMYTGLWSELENPSTSKRGQYLPFFIGCVQQGLIWISIFASYVITVTKLTAPWFVHVFVFQLFAFFNSFAVVEYLWIANWIEKYETKEWWYVFLSLSSKVTLSFLIIGATFS